jgi:hypothetical protein
MYTNDPTIYTAPASGKFYSPLDLAFDPMERLALLNFEDDPDYNCLELQLFDDDVKGKGAAALMYRNDGKLDFYMTTGLCLDRKNAEVGEGVGEWITQDFDYRLEITPRGVDCYAALTLKDGRSLKFRIKENRRRPTRPITILAPLGAGIQRPNFMPLFRMHDIDLVQRAVAQFEWKIGDDARSPINLPMPMPYNGKMVYFVRFCPDPMIGLLNRAYDGPLPALAPDRTSGFLHQGMTYDLIDNEGHYEVRRASTCNPKHEMFIIFSPALPDVACLGNGVELHGRFGVGVDDTADIVAGAYEIRRKGDQIDMAMQPTENWSPRGGWLVKLTLMFFPSIFRTWVKTYRWSAALTLRQDRSPVMRSTWTRTEHS